jgi:hypothetical protein
MTDDISGEWHGTYRYPDGAGPVTPFIAVIEERAGHLSGSIIEPHEFRQGEMAQATLIGRRSGTSIDFTKTYHRSGPQYATPVDYVGRLSDNGNRIAGMWSLLRWDGSFEMYRDAAGGSGIEAEEEAEAMAPALSR